MFGWLDVKVTSTGLVKVPPAGDAVGGEGVGVLIVYFSVDTLLFRLLWVSTAMNLRVVVVLIVIGEEYLLLDALGSEPSVV